MLRTFVLSCIVYITVISFCGICECVTLEWDANDPIDNVTGYNIHRSSQQGTGYVQINTAPIIVTQFEDTTIQAGVRYYYVATAENTQGESGYSNEVNKCLEIGDANLDNERNIFDVINIMNHVVRNVTLTGDNLIAADVNQDSQVNIFDVVQLQNHIVGNIILADCP